MSDRITPQALKELLRGAGELALLDAREEGVFGRSHLLFAAPLPLSQLELRVRALVPRFSCPVVWCDDGGGEADLAAQRMRAMGYGDVRVLSGGIAAWKDAGYEIFSGMHVPSKAFGEFIEHREDTPNISADELNDLLTEGEDLVILDSRPMDEYARMNIPGGINVPGGELVYRVRELAPSPDTLVVVNCAGRTRSIIGAQSLINAGIPNKVVALRNGTMGWHLAGYGLEHGRRRTAPHVPAGHVTGARQQAEAVANRFGVHRVSRATVAQWWKEKKTRTLYVLDVRNPEEFYAGHMPGSRSAPGGQLVQATDYYMATRNARVVLVDDTEVRALMTASWLVQMGWEDVHVLEGGILPFGQESGPERVDIPGLADIEAEGITPAQLAEELAAGGVTVVDLAHSPPFRKGHIPGALWAVRARFGAELAGIQGAGNLVLTSSDGALAWLAAPEAAAITGGRVRVLLGGTQAWEAAGQPLAQGREGMVSTPDDVFPKPYDYDEGTEKEMQNYLDWEVNLVEQIERDGDTRFKFVPRN